MTQYTYQPPQEPNYALLESEYAVLQPGIVLESFEWDGADLVIKTSALSAGEESDLSATVSAHDPEPLAQLQARLKTQSTAYFYDKLAQGASHDGALFSESAQAQAQWVYLKGNGATLTYPYNLPTLGGQYYTVADETALLVVVNAVIADVQSKTEAFTTACNDITVAGTKTAAQAAYDAYAV